MPSSVILGTARTPVGKMGGTLSSVDATELGGTAIEAALERSGVGAEQIQQVIFGQVLQAGQGQVPSRQAQIKGGIPKEVPSETVNKVCASGMRTLGLADQAIRAGDLEVAVTGGMESMSKAPWLLPNARFGFRMGDVQALDTMTHDGLTNPFTGKQMINEASEVSNELEITRADMDRFAERSQHLAGEAIEAGRVAEEIVAVTVKSRKGETTVELDEGPRPETTLEALSKLRAVGGDGATHTAGNAPGVNDGAGALVLEAQEQPGTAKDRGVLTTHLRSDGRHKAKLYVDGGPSSTQTVGHLRMEGREVFKHAVAMITDVIEDAFKATGYTAADIDWFVPHQANKRILDGIAKKLGIPPHKVVITLDKHGNTSAASIPLALADAVADRRIKRGHLILLEAMGGGFTWGSALLRW